jgi:hypothetical protein
VFPFFGAWEREREKGKREEEREREREEERERGRERERERERERLLALGPSIVSINMKKSYPPPNGLGISHNGV